jgi:hypothetical protein
MQGTPRENGFFLELVETVLRFGLVQSAVSIDWGSL